MGFVVQATNQSREKNESWFSRDSRQSLRSRRRVASSRRGVASLPGDVLLCRVVLGNAGLRLVRGLIRCVRQAVRLGPPFVLSLFSLIHRCFLSHLSFSLSMDPTTTSFPTKRDAKLYVAEKSVREKTVQGLPE